MTAPAVDVETDLAASILAMWALVRSDLASAPPRVGRIEGQAEDVFAKHSGHWNALIADACDELAGEHSLPYAKSLGALVSGEAAKGLALGMDIQLARGQNPEVAWQHVLAGYGLDVRTMRGLLGGAMPTPSSAGGAGVASSVAARTAERSLLLRAQKLASVEAKAWAAAKEEVDKKFDPTQTRDKSGQWAADPTAPAMAADLNAHKGVYADDLMRAWTLDRDTPQFEARQAFEEKFGEPGKRLAMAVDDWVGHSGVSRARHVEHGTQDRSPLARARLRHATPYHRVLLDAVKAAPPTEVPLYRGASYADVSPLRRGATVTMPVTSFSATSAGAERFAWKGLLQHGKQSVVFEVVPGARALNLSALTTLGVSPNEWITSGRFKVISARREQREIRFDPTAKKGRVHDVLHVRLRHVADPVGKAFDPRELREANGRWAARPQLLERESEAPEKRSAPTEVKPEGDRLAEVDRYAPAETDRYAAVQTDRYAATATDRYAAVAAQATEAPAEQDRYAPDDRYAAVAAPAENRVISTTIVFAPKKLGDAPPPPEPPSPPGRRYYFPVSDVPEYYHGQGMEMSNHGAGYNSVINFKDIADYYRYNDDTRKLPLQLKFSEWEVVKPIEGITQQKWDTALKYAVPLHKIAMEHPVELAKELGANDLQEIAERAGYQSYAGPGPIRDAIATDFQMSKTDPKGYDPSLALAMADYVVWSKPEALQHLGQRLKLQADFQGERRRVDHLAEDLGDTLTMFISKLRLAPIPGVISFGGGLHGHDAVNPDKITGKYKVNWVAYRSSIAEQGLGADVGKIGFREIKTKPQH